MANELFTIFKVDVEEAEAILRGNFEPHAHDFEELIIGIEGQLEHFIDFQSVVVDAPFISFVTRGKIHRLRPLPKDGRCDMWVLRFESEFIAETTFQLYASFHDNANVCIACNSCFSRLDTLCRLISDEYNHPSPNLAVIRQLLSALIVIIEDEKQKRSVGDTGDVLTVQNLTFKNFLRLLEEHYHEPRSVGFYADQLFMTVRNLNLICQNVVHQSVSEIIETRKLTEAKNLLLTTGKTIAEIGYELGFNEKTYFTHAFKRKSGVTPSDFRREMKKILS